jgi:hypothetical protein
MFEQDTADAFAVAAMNRQHSWLDHSDAAFQLALALVGTSVKSKDLSAALEHLGKGCLASIDSVRPLWSCVELVLGFSESNVPCDYLLRRVADVALQRPLELPSHTIVALVRAFSKLQGVPDSRDRARVEKLVATCLLRCREMEVQDFRALVDTKTVLPHAVLRRMLLQYLCSVLPSAPAAVMTSMLQEFVAVADCSAFDALWQRLFALLQHRQTLQWSSSHLADICLVLHSCSARVSAGDHATSFMYACAKHVAGEARLCSDSSLSRCCNAARVSWPLFHIPCSAISLCQALGWPHDLVLAIGHEASKRSLHEAAPSLSIEDSVAAMNMHLKLHQSNGVASAAAEKGEIPPVRSSNQGWTPRCSVLK